MNSARRRPGGDPAGNDSSAVENAATQIVVPASSKRLSVPPQPSSASSVCGASTKTRFGLISKRLILPYRFPILTLPRLTTRACVRSDHGTHSLQLGTPARKPNTQMKRHFGQVGHHKYTSSRLASPGHQSPVRNPERPALPRRQRRQTRIAQQSCRTPPWNLLPRLHLALPTFSDIRFSD